MASKNAPEATPRSTGNPVSNFFSSMFYPKFTIYVPPFQVPFELYINPRNSLYTIITKLLKDLNSKIHQSPYPNPRYQYPSDDDWVMIEITTGKENKLIHGNLAKDYIQSGSAYLVLSAKGAMEFGNKASSREKRFKQEEVLQWLEDIASGKTMTPTSSDDGKFSLD